MEITIRKTVSAEAEELAQIQKAAFLPLYEKFHDEGNPCLRGAEDILKRLNKNNRYFTILVDGKIIGGVFYRCVGTRPPYINIGEGEYYLCRIYIHPEYQSKGIASKVILLCENEFADAKVYHIDFPSVMAKNRRCYEKAGFEDTGITMTIPNAPELAIYKKIVKDEFDISGVTLPFIYEVSKEELEICLDVIHKSFTTITSDVNFEQSFVSLCSLEAQMKSGWRMFGLYAGKKIIGFMSLSKENDSFKLHHLAILPEYSHKGFDKQLLDYAKENVKYFNK